MFYNYQTHRVYQHSPAFPYADKNKGEPGTFCQVKNVTGGGSLTTCGQTTPQIMCYSSDYHMRGDP